MRGAALLGMVVLLASCGGGKAPNKLDLGGVPAGLRAAAGGGGGGGGGQARVQLDGMLAPTALGAGGTTAAVAGVASGASTNANLVWTDPDDPDAIIPELDNILEKPKEGPWERSIVLARSKAMREGKCQLIWFTDSQTSPACKALSAELFGLHAFGAWADENLVRLRIDTREPDRAPDDDSKARAAEYVTAVRKHYKVLGSPTVIMLTPQGEVIKAYRGFRPGSGDFFWGQLKQAQRIGSESFGKWRAGLERSGYRDWVDRGGRRKFARLLSYQDGQLMLVEPDGTQSKAQESLLSEGDRLWLAEQKRSRGIR